MRTDPEAKSLWAEAIRLTRVVDTQIPFRGPDLERNADGTLSMASGDLSSEAQRLHELLYELGVIHSDNHPGDWYEASTRIDLEGLSVEELFQLLTWVSRTDRFVEGILVEFFNAGVMTKAVRRLYELSIDEV